MTQHGPGLNTAGQNWKDSWLWLPASLRIKWVLGKKHSGKVKTIGLILTILPIECWLIYRNMGLSPICPIWLMMWNRYSAYFLLTSFFIWLKILSGIFKKKCIWKSLWGININISLDESSLAESVAWICTLFLYLWKSSGQYHKRNEQLLLEETWGLGVCEMFANYWIHIKKTFLKEKQETKWNQAGIIEIWKINLHVIIPPKNNNLKKYRK